MQTKRDLRIEVLEQQNQIEELLKENDDLADELERVYAAGEESHRALLDSITLGGAIAELAADFSGYTPSEIIEAVSDSLKEQGLIGG